MRLFSALLISAGLIGTSAAALAATPDNSRNEAKLAAALAGRVAGKPVSCITLSSAQSSQIIDRTAILYDTGRTIYVNRPESGRESLDSDDILVTKLYSSQLCNVDIVRLVDRGSRMETGFVGLGEFVPYTKPPKN